MSRLAETGSEATSDCGPDLAGAEAAGEPGGDEGVARVFVGEVAGADQLPEAEGGAVEGVVARAWDGGVDSSELGVEGGASPGTGVETLPRAHERWRRQSGCGFEDPFGERSDGVGGSPPVGPTSVVDAGRGDDVAAVSSDIDSGSEPAGAVMDVPAGVGEPVMATAASGVNREAWREGAVAALEFGQ